MERKIFLPPLFFFPNSLKRKQTTPEIIKAGQRSNLSIWTVESKTLQWLRVRLYYLDFISFAALLTAVAEVGTTKSKFPNNYRFLLSALLRFIYHVPIAVNPKKNDQWLRNRSNVC